MSEQASLPSIIRVVDLESSGFDPAEHCVIEIGWSDLVADGYDLSLQPHYARIGDGGGFLVKPTRSIPPESSAIHQLCDEDFGPESGAIDWLTAAKTVVGGTGVRALAAHHAAMERSFLTPELIGDVDWICTHKCALRTWPDLASHSNQALRWWLKPADLVRYRALPPHRATPDAYATSFILRALLALNSIETLIQWTKEPTLLVRVPFGENRGKKWTEVDDGLLTWVLSKNFDTDVVFTVKTEIARREAARREQIANARPMSIEPVGSAS